MPRFCLATNGWRNKRLCDAWKAENRSERRKAKNKKSRYKKQNNFRQVPAKWIVIKHGSGHEFMYNGRPESATIRIQLAGPHAACPWPEFSTWSDLTLSGTTTK